jgi:putative transposase
VIDPDYPLSVVRQAKLLDISPGAVYYQPRPPSEADLAMMRRIDGLHLEHPSWVPECLAARWLAKESSWAAVIWAR